MIDIDGAMEEKRYEEAVAKLRVLSSVTFRKTPWPADLLRLTANRPTATVHPIVFLCRSGHRRNVLLQVNIYPKMASGKKEANSFSYLIFFCRDKISAVPTLYQLSHSLPSCKWRSIDYSHLHVLSSVGRVQYLVLPPTRDQAPPKPPRT